MLRASIYTMYSYESSIEEGLPINNPVQTRESLGDFLDHDVDAFPSYFDQIS